MIDPAVQLAAFIAKFDQASQTRIHEVRAALCSLLPTANELVYDNYNFFVIGYCPTERPSDCIVSIAAGANGLSLSFYRGTEVPDPDGLLLGSGNQNRFIRVPTADVLAQPGIVTLIERATMLGPALSPPGHGGKLIIRSISARQRPRRKA